MVDLPNIKFFFSDIFLGLGDLKSNLNPGPDGVPEILLVSYKYALSVPSHIIFNWSLIIFNSYKWGISMYLEAKLYRTNIQNRLKKHYI